MVAHGVKGRPQACVTCHRRKKGCDLARPSCGQCRKACIPCGGYNRGPTSSRATIATSRAATTAGSSSSSSSIKPNDGSVEIARASSNSSSSAGHPTPGTSSSSSVVATPPAAHLPPRQPQTVGVPLGISHVATSTPGHGHTGVPIHYPAAAAIPTTAPGHASSRPLGSVSHPPPPPPLPYSHLSYGHEAAPAPVPAPRISYPDLSGSLTLQPRYPGHFPSSSSSINESYALYAPSTFTYYDNNDPSHHHPTTYDEHAYYQQQEQQEHQGQKLARQTPAEHRRHNLVRARQRQRLHHQHATSDIQISSAISNSAQNERLIGLFWEVFLPNAKPLPTKTLQITLGGAVGAIGSFDWDGDVLKQGLLAMALTTIGKKQILRAAATGVVDGLEDAERMRREGIKLYGSSLQQMSKSLSGRSRWTTEHWVTTRLFSLYEALYGADLQDHLAHRESWMVHSQGDIAFITSKPPSAYISDPAHTLFTAGRHHLVLYALLTRRRCVLAEPAWKWIPWTEHPKSARDLLLDIVIDLPAIYEAIDAVNSWPDDYDVDTGKKEAARIMIRRGLTAFVTRLLEWHAGHAMTTVPPSLDHAPPETATPEQFLAGHIMTLYWAVCIRVYNHERTLLRLEHGEAPDPRIDPDACCRGIVNTIRVFVQPSTGMCRQHFTVFPMSTAVQHLIDIGPGRMQRERASLWADLNKPQSALVKGFMMNMEPPRYRNAEEAKLGP